MQKLHTGQSGISLASNFLLIAASFFWVIIFWTLIGPQAPKTINDAPLSLLYALLAVFLGIGMAITQPSLLAPLLPRTPAGMMLQESQRRTTGFAALIVISGLLAKFSFDIMLSWWTARMAGADNTGDTSYVLPMTVITLVLFNGPAALLWSWSTPAQWAADIAQAHEVKKLRLAHQTELAIMKAHYLAAMGHMTQSLENGLLGLTYEDADKIVRVIEGLHVGQNEAISKITGLLALSAEVDNLIDDEGMDQHILQQGDELRKVLRKNIVTMQYVGDNE